MISLSRQWVALTGAQGEDRLFKMFVAVSAACHLLFVLMDDLSWLDEPTPLVDEWVMDAEIINDFDFSAPDKSSLPKAEKGREARVPEKMLPQLPKKFAIKELENDASGLSDAIAPDPKTKKKKEKRSENSLNIKSDKDEANKMKMSEAIHRLKLEKLRLQKKVAKKTEADIDDPLARIRDEYLKRKDVNSGPLGGLTGNVKKYAAVLKSAVRSNYSLPEAYNLKGANMRVVIAITVTERGELMALNVHKPSGDQVFDELTVKAVKSSVPLPRPPRELAGESILLQFKP